MASEEVLTKYNPDKVSKTYVNVANKTIVCFISKMPK